MYIRTENSTVNVGSHIVEKRVRDAANYQQEKRALERLDGIEGLPKLLKCEDAKAMLLLEKCSGQTITALQNNPIGVSIGIKTLIIRQIASALAAIHSLDIAHNDFASDQVIYDRQNKKSTVLDFGNAIFTTEPISPTRRSSGKIEFMDPAKLFTDMDFHPKKSDVFSLGCVAYYLLSGRKAFDIQRSKSIGDIWTQLASYEPPKIKVIPRKLSVLIQSMLEKDFRNRPSSSEVSKALSRV